MKGKPYLDEIYWHVIPDAAARAWRTRPARSTCCPAARSSTSTCRGFQAAEYLRHDQGLGDSFAPHAWLAAEYPPRRPSATSNSARRVMYAIDRDFGKDVIWNGLGKVATGPIRSTIKFYTADVPKYAFDPAKAKAAAEGSRLQGREGSPAAAALWRDLEALGRGHEAESGRTSGSTSRSMATDVAGWNQKVSDWDYDMDFNYLYQFGDPALGVAATTSPATSPRASVHQRRRLLQPGDRQAVRRGAVAFAAMRSARRSTRRRRRSWSTTCRWFGCWSWISRPSIAATSRTWSPPASAWMTVSATRGWKSEAAVPRRSRQARMTHDFCEPRPLPETSRFEPRFRAERTDSTSVRRSFDELPNFSRRWRRASSSFFAIIVLNFFLIRARAGRSRARYGGRGRCRRRVLPRAAPRKVRPRPAAARQLWISTSRAIVSSISAFLPPAAAGARADPGATAGHAAADRRRLPALARARRAVGRPRGAPSPAAGRHADHRRSRCSSTRRRSSGSG